MKDKSWEERIADYIWKEFWILAIGVLVLWSVLWFIDYPFWPATGYWLIGNAISIWMGWNTQFPKRNSNE